MIDKEQVMRVIKMKCLVVPSDLVREFRADTFIMGAVLSDLVHEKKLAVTTLKMGGSPVYYIPENKEKIQDLFRYLHEKDKNTYLLLKEQKVVADAEQTPLLRVSLRSIKDFAKPIEVTAAGQTQLFWKWYLASEQEVHTALQKLYSSLKIPSIEAPIEEKPLSQPSLPSTSEEKSEHTEEISKPLQKKHKKEFLQEKQQVVSENSSPLSPPLIAASDDSFAQQVSAFFSQKYIKVSSFSAVKKGEIDCVIELPSAFGPITYFCKAKNKKKCTEGELATTFVAAQLKKLPAAFLTTGEVSKKVLQKISMDYPNMKIINLQEEKT